MITPDLTPEAAEHLARALELVATIEDSFPSSRFSQEQRLQYAKDVAHLHPDEAKAAAEVLKRTPTIDGRPRQFAPTAGEVAFEVARLQIDAPDWGECKRQLVKRQEAILAGRDAPDTWVCPFDRCDGGGFEVDEATNTATDCECRPARTAARRAADELHPLLREFIDQDYVTWGEIAEVGHGGATTLEAQMRGKWDAYAARAVESRAIAAIDAPPSLRRLEDARGEDAPRRRRALGRPDFTAALPRAS
jgi:hypothetical protein